MPDAQIRGDQPLFPVKTGAPSDIVNVSRKRMGHASERATYVFHIMERQARRNYQQQPSII
jgi:hypothetical protein